MPKYVLNLDNPGVLSPMFGLIAGVCSCVNLKCFKLVQNLCLLSFLVSQVPRFMMHSILNGVSWAVFVYKYGALFVKLSKAELIFRILINVCKI